MIKEKSICIINQSGSYGGLEIHTLTLIRMLLQRGYTVDFVCCRHSFYDALLKEDSHYERVNLIKTDLSINATERDARKRWEVLLKPLSTSLLVLPKGIYYLGSIPFLKVCRAHFKGIYFIEHLEADPMPPKASRRYLGGLFKGPGLWWYKQKHLRRARASYADRIIAVSDFVRTSLVRSCSYPPEKVVTIHNGVYWSSLRRDEKMRHEFRRQHTIPQGAFVFGMLTRIAPEKGADLALEAFHRLACRHKDREIYLVIAGQGEEEQKIKALAQNLEAHDKIIFTGFATNIRAVLSSYDAILLPSRKEGLPLSLLEGMAAGCVPIVSKIAGMPEAVNSPEIGWVVEPEDPDALFNAMHDAVSLSAEEFSLKGARATERIRDHFDAAHSFERLVDVFEENEAAIAQRSRHRPLYGNETFTR